MAVKGGCGDADCIVAPGIARLLARLPTPARLGNGSAAAANRPWPGRASSPPPHGCGRPRNRGPLKDGGAGACRAAPRTTRTYAPTPPMARLHRKASRARPRGARELGALAPRGRGPEGSDWTTAAGRAAAAHVGAAQGRPSVASCGGALERSGSLENLDWPARPLLHARAEQTRENTRFSVAWADAAHDMQEQAVHHISIKRR